MSSNFNRPLKFEIKLPSDHPHLLEGLDQWLRLGLISDTQVKQLCWEYLSCRVILEPQFVPQRQTETAVTEPGKSAEKPKVAATPNLVSTMWRSLRAEFSVRWLLFLGMFTVVVSSGALAASQWERFTPLLQYGVLFAYTVLFFGLSFWTSIQANLRLTSGALHIVTMLLIPINFWAMDSFGLWQNPINLVLVGIASIILTGITVLLSKQSIFAGSVPVSKLSLINILGLSYLHWGWKFSGFPLIAVYLAFIGTAIITVFQNLQSARREGEEKVEKEEKEEKVEKNKSQFSWGKNVPAVVIIYSSIILLIRAIIGAGINVAQLGLAIGICGWLIAWLAQREENEKRRQGDKETRGQKYKKTSTPSPQSPNLPTFPSQAIGRILLFLGWFVAVWSNPSQAIAVSGLGLWFFHSRLHLYSSKRDLTAFFAIGLQSMLLGWRLLPDDFHSAIITTATQFTNSQDNPWALLSVGLFPYIIFMVAFTNNLRRKAQPVGISRNQQDNSNKSSEQDARTTNKSSEQDARTTNKSSEQGNFNKSSEQDARTTNKSSEQGNSDQLSEQSNFKSSEEGNSKSSEQSNFKSSEQSTFDKSSEQNKFKLSGQSNFKSREQSNFKSSEQSTFDKLSEQDNYKSSEQDNYKSSEQDNYKSSEQDNYKSSEQDNYKSSEQDNYKSSEQDNYKSSEQDNYKS
ncbi:MAG: hypothetical protein WBA39_08720, partial [Rivularia sp. (in: cyanobacteria)]